ncbi:hypothetical protein [Tenacibaculum sp. M341]|uniref:hypothetical protein n=1 Tax=Tenacibaculum sp. M341 TaxID=2530339 RepID=UPI00104D3B95|nr:hypothetical protein [Tenacibaculum sp. M341]TCI93513.1 hypothetical protein EYW44_03655 [Tenacibaculum sp. M341]
MIRNIKIALIAILLVSANLFSQEILGSFTNDLKKTSYNIKIKEAIPIVNELNGDVIISITDAKNIYTYKLNDQFKIIDKLASEDKRRKYKVLLGHSIAEDGGCSVYLSNKNKTKFLHTSFSFNEKKTTSKEFKLELSNERLLQTISHKNKFYILSHTKSFTQIVPKLFIYAFDHQGNYKRHQLSLNNIAFEKSSSQQTFITQLKKLTEETMSKVDDNTPTSIEIAAKPFKLYVKDGKALISFDKEREYTQVLNINLNTFEVTGDFFDKPMSETSKKSNSFINGKTILISSASKEKLVLQILNYDTKELLKEYTILRDEPITFKNTPIIQEGGAYTTLRKLEKSKKFLRKVTKDHFGVSVRKLPNTYHLTIGGYAQQASAGGMMMMGGFGAFPIASFGNVSMFFNPVQFAYGSMANTKSVRIESLLDFDFNHVEGEIKDDVFDKIDDSLGESRPGDVIFKYKDFYITGYYLYNTKKYTLKKFTD